jgi:hypothetical protein
MKDRLFRTSPLAVIFVSLIVTTIAAAQRPAPRITQQIDPNQRVTLHGNTPPLARAAFDQGPAPDSMMESRMLLVLSRSDEQEKALRQLLDEQQTAGSPNFHKWLTPEEFGQQFGPADSDLQSVTTWLLNNGFQVTEVSPGKNVIEFSGTVGQLRQVFHTDIRKYVIGGAEHWANANDPQIPAALAPVVKGIASLNNFGLRPQSHTFNVMKHDVQTGETMPLITTGGTPPYYPIGPADFSVIYGSRSLLQAGNDGSGQTIAIVGRTNINLQDVTDFRTLFGLPMTPDNHTSVILNGPDPGIVPGDETESLLDVEWAGAVAPGASIVLVASESTTTVDGVDLSALYIIQHNLAPVMSVSYGACESAFGNAGNQFHQSLWEQAAAQGITVSVSAGDNGSAGCDDPNSETVASNGIAVNGLASTPFNIAVGGTDFNDATTQTTYFNSTNGTGYLSAKSYVPEKTWNDSCAGGTSPTTSSCTSSQNLQLWAGSGGPSNCSKVSGGKCSGTVKPAWQTGIGVPSDGVRDVPDISLFAEGGVSASHSFYVMCEADLLPYGYQSCTPSGGYVYYVPIGGTSAGAPAFAGAVALANQKLNRRLGNLNYLLYSIAAQSGSSCSTGSTSTSCVFRDVATGANTVPCKGGTPNCSATTGTGVLVDSGKLAYMTATGYDRATGLGSPNIANLITKIGQATFTPSTTNLTLNGKITTVQANHGDSINVAVNVSPSAATGDVSLIGNNGTTDNSGIDSSKLTSGAATWGSTLFPGGSYTVHAHYAGDGTRGASDSSAVSVNIAPENSKTFVNLVTFDLSGNLTSYTATSAEYGSPYILRMDVGDSAAAISSTTGVSSKCTNGTASCPTGTLTVTSNGNPLDGGNWPLNNEGHSEDQPIQLTPGTYNVVANYPGDSSYNASTANANIIINKATTALTATVMSAGPYTYGTGFPINAALTSSSNGAAPGGSLTWLDNGVDASSNIRLLYSSPNAGGSSGYAGVTYSVQYTPSSVGSHTLMAQYSGDSNYAAVAAAPVSFTVTQAQLYSSYSAVRPNVATPAIPVTLTIQLSSSSSFPQSPAGTISFYDNGVLLSGTVTYNRYPNEISASMSYTFTQNGQHTITASYSGDTYFAALASGSVGTVTVSDKLTPNMQTTSSFAPALVNYATTLTTLVYIPTDGTPYPTGTVTFTDNGQPMNGTVSYSGSTNIYATLNYTFTTSGTHTIAANYSGDGIYAPTTNSLSLTVVDKFATNIPYLNGQTSFVVDTPSTLAATVQSSAMFQGPAMTGTVTFKDGDTTVTGTPTVQNLAGYMIAVVPYSFTAAGTHNITVQYSGDDHYAPVSNTFPVQVEGQLSIQLQYDSYTPGANGGSGTLAVWAYNNISSPQTVNLTCTPDSSAATCSVSPSTLSLSGSSANSTNVTFTVPALSASADRKLPFTMPFLFACVLAGLCFGGRKQRASAILMIVCVLAIGMISCGGGGSTGGTTPIPPPTPSSKVYKFTITGTAGTNTDSKVLTVTVQR